MKKFLSMILIAMIALGLSACGNGEDEVKTVTIVKELDENGKITGVGSGTTAIIAGSSENFLKGLTVSEM